MTLQGTHTVDSLIREHVSKAPADAVFVTELLTALGDGAPSKAQVDASLARLEASDALVVVDFPSPDVHLDGTDLRVVAAIQDGGDAHAAREAAERVWGSWLRTFLASHRCG